MSQFLTCMLVMAGAIGIAIMSAGLVLLWLA
jgi:hypothetical protein